MIRKWKVTPVSSKHRAEPERPESRSKDDETVPIRTTQVLQVKSRKPRRHTAGDTKQTVEDIQKAKAIVDAMNGQANTVEHGVVDPNSTLGRKQLISMLKERYGNEMDGFRTSGDKERIRRERQRERDLRHTNQRIVQENREMNHHGGVHHSPHMNGNRDHFCGTASEESDDSMSIGVQRRLAAHGKSSKHMILRRSDSEDDGSKDGSCEKLQIPPASTFNNSENVIRSNGVVFLQYADDVKRVNLPAPITSIETLKALFVNSFPDRIQMQDFEDGMKVIYIKDVDTGTYYMLEDVREVLNRCFLKIHEKSPPSLNTSTNHLANNFETSGILKNTTTQKTFTKSASLDKSFHTSSPRGSISGNITSNKTSNTSSCPVHTNQVQDSTLVPQSHSTPKRNLYTKSRSQDIETISSTTSSSVDNNHSDSYNNNKIQVTTTTDDVRRSSDVKTRADSYTSSASKHGSVEDQLDDLTELLKSALGDDEKQDEETMECVNTKNPGKLNPSLVENIQRETQTLARKSTLPKHFTPTIMVAAQQESDRRTERSGSEGDRDTTRTNTTTKTSTSTAVKVKVGRQLTNNEKDSNEINNNHSSTINTTNCKINEKNEKYSNDVKVFTDMEENISYSQKGQFNCNNTHAIDITDGGNFTSEPVTVQTAPINIQPQAKIKDLHSKLETAEERHNSVTSDDSHVISGENVDTSKMSDVLMDQIMGMELEVRARSNDTIRRNERSSSESSCSKSSSIQCETLNTSLEDQPKRERLAQCTEMNGSYTNGIINGAATNGEERVTMENGNHATTLKHEKEEEKLHLNGISDDKTATDELTSMQHIYASISKVTALPTSSKVTTTFSSTTNSTVEKPPLKRSSTREKACHHASVSAPDFSELEDSARCVHTSLQKLRRELADLRKAHTDGVRSFKADIQKKLLEFRKKASRVDEALQQKLDVNNNIIFADQHPVRERRHRLSADQLSYNDKMSNTEVRLKYLEGDMETVRCSVVDKKRVEDPYKLKQLHEELTQLTKGLAEIKNRFHGLHDMLKVVITDEQKIITNEEKFLKEEPKKLEGLIARCKVLSGTLFTLERLASVQLEQGDTKTPQQQQQHETVYSQIKTTTTSRNSDNSNYTKSTTQKTAASYNYNQSAPFNDVFDIEDLKGKRNVHFKHKN